MKSKSMKEYAAILARWLLIAAVAGVSSAAIVAAFNGLLTRMIERSPGLIPRVPQLVPVLGALLAGTLFLRWLPGTGGEGIPAYILGVNMEKGKFRILDSVLKFPATFVTLGFHGSGGIVGPLARINAGISSFLVERLFRPLRLGDQDYVRIAAICGVGGAVGAIFHAPLGGGIFAAEILHKDTMRYTDLFPSILSAAAAYFTSLHLLRQGPVFSVAAPSVSAAGTTLLWLPVVAVAAGAFGMIFIIVFERVYRLFRRLPLGQPAGALIGGLLICTVWSLGARWILGTSMPLYRAIASGDLSTMRFPAQLHGHLTILLAVIVAAKILATSFTVGSGMSGGFTGPLVIIGMGGGALMSSIVGIAPGSPAYFAFMACALAAVLGGAMNIPVAAIIITARMFGPQYIIPAIIGGLLSFLLFRARTVYEYYSVSN